MGHDVKHHIVGLAHGFLSDARQIADAAVHVLVDDAFGGGDVLPLNAEHSRENGGGDTTADLQCTAGLGAVANHSGEVGYHVLHRIAYALEIAAHEVGDATAAADAGYHTAAERRQSAETLLDVDGREMTQTHGTDEFFLRVLVLSGEHGNGIGGADALVARTAVRHHGNHGASHAGVAG